MTKRELTILLFKIERTQLNIRQLIDLATLEGGDTMVDPKVAALITQFDDATNAIAARIQKLIDAGGLSVDSEAALQAEVDKLKALGADPEVPVP